MPPGSADGSDDSSDHQTSEDDADEPSGRNLTSLLDPVGAPLLAALTTAAVYVIAQVIRGGYPFGNHTRLSSVLSGRVVPLYTHLWDLAHGRGGGDLLLNWTSGLGVPFLPDLATYLTNPFALITLALPRADVTAGVLLAVPLTMGLAAGAMTVYLRSIAPGRWWLRVPLGVSYGLCAWALDQSTVPVWLWGLAAFPLLCLAAEWGLRRVHWIGAAVLVGVAWFGGLATAPAATAGALLAVTVRFLIFRPSARYTLRAVLRVLTSFATGIGLAGVLLAPMYEAYRTAGISARLNGADLAPFGWHDLLASLLPATGPAADVPGLAAGTLVLVLALAFPLNRHIPLTARIAWPAALLAVLLSYTWPVTERLWEGFAVPGSGSYLGGFVLSGLLVIVAWQCVYEPPQWWAVAAAGGAVGLVWLLAASGTATWTLVPVVGAAGLAAYLLRAGVPFATLPTPPAAVRNAGLALLGCAVVAECAVAAVTVDGTWNQSSYTGWSATDAAVYTAAADANRWPTYRTEAGAATAGSGMLYGSQNLEYDSVYTSAATVTALATLGFGYTDYGHELTWTDDPVTDTILSVGARVTTGADGNVRVATAAVPSLVTLHKTLLKGEAGAADTNVFVLRDSLLNAVLYYVPPTTVTRDGGQITLTASCFAGTKVYLWAPELTARATGPDGATATLDGQGSQTHAPVAALGTVATTGAITVKLSDVSGTLPADPIGCLDPTALRNAQAALAQAGATGLGARGHEIAAQLADGSAGTEVIAVADAAGWSCTTGHGTTVPGDYHGLLSVPVSFGDATVACAYTPPGYVTGGLVSGAAAVLIPLVAAFAWWRRRDPVPLAVDD